MSDEAVSKGIYFTFEAALFLVKDNLVASQLRMKFYAMNGKTAKFKKANNS